MKGGFESCFGRDISADAKLECGICWYVYDPDVGDDYWQIPKGTAFVDLPEHWQCPQCAAGKEKFIVLGS
jgi:rubredoxin